MPARSMRCVCLLALSLLSTSLAIAATPETGKWPTAPAADYQPDPASVQRSGAGYRYPQSGWIVVHIEGAPYERGYQHGQLLAAEIADHILAQATIRSPQAPADAWRDLRMMVNALFLRKYDAEYLQEMKGIADGAAAAGAKFDNRPLDLVDIVAVNSSIEVDFLDAGLEATATGLEELTLPEPAEGHPAAGQDDHCSAFAATGPATADGQIVFGHITMFHLYAVRHFNVWLDIQPQAGRRCVFQAFPGAIFSGLDYYMNDAGLLCSETTIAQTKFDVDGAPLAARIRRVVQYAESIDKAVEMLLTQNNGLYTNEWLLGDIKTGEVAMFELGTQKHKLWRSSRDEFPGGTPGFYWGCNNAKDLDVRKETVPSLAGRPANLLFRPAPRDVKWQQLYAANKGKLNLDFGFEAFTTSPLAAFRSCDAKFTTTKLAKELKSWALFGPPLGRTWDATPEETRRLSDIQPLVSNDWALVHVQKPAADTSVVKAVDLAPFPKSEHAAANRTPWAKPHPQVLPPAWHGTLLPASDADLWLAAAFADYERIVALEKSLTKQAKDGKLDHAAKDKLAIAQFAPLSRWLTATRRLGRDLPLSEVRTQWDTNHWYAIAAGKGTLLLSTLRSQVGAEAFDKALDGFGKAHAGQNVTVAQFREHLEKSTGQSLAAIIEPWLNGGGTVEPRENFWSVDSFEVEPERALIVYGTLQDKAAQREAAELLQRKIARRYSNYSIRLAADHEVSDDDLKQHHVLLIGRPSANALTARMATGMQVRFGSGSFVVRDETYAHADSAVIAAAANPLNDRYSVVVFAGLGARATRRAIESLPNRGGDPAEILLLPVGQSTRLLHLVPAALNTAMP